MEKKPEQELAEILMTHNWSFVLDSSSSSENEQSLENIKRMTEVLAQIPTDEGRKIWSKFAPSTVPFPLG